jgi:hypothetical protein
MSVLFSLIPTRRPRTQRAAEAAVLAAFLLHVMGHAFGLYAKLAYYDKALHTAVPFVIVLVLYALSQSTGWLWAWTRVTPAETGVYLFAMTAAISAFWEIVEFTTDSLFGTHEQGGNADTMLDLVADFVGAALGALLAASATRYGRAHGFGSIAEPSSDGREDGTPGARSRAALRAHAAGRVRALGEGLGRGLGLGRLTGRRSDREAPVERWSLSRRAGAIRTARRRASGADRSRPGGGDRARSPR